MAQRQDLKDESAPKYSVRDPHPLFGIDPNIINELGHTRYPRWVDHPTLRRVDKTVTNIGRDQQQTNVINTDFPERVLVQNEEEEKALLKASKKEWTAK